MMAKQKSAGFILAFLISLGLNIAHADEHHHDEQHAHEVHVHGAWELFAALDNKQFSVTLKGPIIDVLGFERPSADERDRAAIDDFKHRLNDPETLFALSSRADCLLSESVKIVLPEGFSEKIEKEDAGTHKHDDHPENHDHDNDGDSDSDRDHYTDDGHHTSNIEISYIFECSSPSRLAELNVTGFGSFSAIESVDAVFLGDAKQVANRLQRHAPTLKIE